MANPKQTGEPLATTQLQPKVTIHQQPIASTIKGAVAGAAAHVNAVHASAQVKGKGSEGK